MKEDIENKFMKKNLRKKYQILKNVDEEAAFERFCNRVGVEVPKKRSAGFPVHWRRLACVAASVAAIMVGIIVMRLDGGNTVMNVADIKHAGSCAYLTTESGASVDLDNSSQSIAIDGLLAQTTDGMLSVEDNGTAARNVITVPRGGEYHVTLSDGTKVHLNAESSLEFPSHFNGNARKVKLTGEAYFDVAHVEDMPFLVEAGHAVVKQYGTHYNVDAYNTRSVKVTLVEGSISVRTNNTGEHFIKSGQQAVVSHDAIGIKNVDVAKETGWNKGVFCFEDANLADIASTLTRWYDMDIEVDKSLASLHFTGSLMRDDNLADILDAICELTGTTYEYNNGKIKLYRK